MVEKEMTNPPADRRITIDNGLLGSELDQENFIKIRQCDDINQTYKKQAIFDNIKPESIFDLKFVQKWSKKKGFIRFIVLPAQQTSSEDKFATLIAEFKKKTEPSGKYYHTIAMMSPLEEVENLNLPKFKFSDYYPKDKK